MKDIVCFTPVCTFSGMDRQEKIISVSVLFIVEGQSVNAKELAAGKEDFAAI